MALAIFGSFIQKLSLFLFLFAIKIYLIAHIPFLKRIFDNINI